VSESATILAQVVAHAETTDVEEHVVEEGGALGYDPGTDRTLVQTVTRVQCTAFDSGVPLRGHAPWRWLNNGSGPGCWLRSGGSPGAG
jgi:hypothetical protein